MVPVEVIEYQIQNMLAGRGKQLAPRAVELIMVAIKANEVAFYY